MVTAGNRKPRVHAPRHRRSGQPASNHNPRQALAEQSPSLPTACCTACATSLATVEQAAAEAESAQPHQPRCRKALHENNTVGKLLATADLSSSSVGTRFSSQASRRHQSTSSRKPTPASIHCLLDFAIPAHISCQRSREWPPSSRHSLAVHGSSQMTANRSLFSAAPQFQTGGSHAHQASCVEPWARMNSQACLR